MEFKRLADNVIRDGSSDDIFNVMLSAIDIAAAKYPVEFLTRRSKLVNLLISKTVDDRMKIRSIFNQEKSHVVQEEALKTTPQHRIFKIDKKKIEGEAPLSNLKASVTNQEVANDHDFEVDVLKATPHPNSLKIKLKIKKKKREGEGVAPLGNPKRSISSEEVSMKVNEFKVEAPVTNIEILKKKLELGLFQVKHARRKVRVNLGCGRGARIPIR